MNGSKKIGKAPYSGAMLVVGRVGEISMIAKLALKKAADLGGLPVYRRWAGQGVAQLGFREFPLWLVHETTFVYQYVYI